MIELDKQGLDLCVFQAKLFALSRKRVMESSPFFTRRFMKSDLALELDEKGYPYGLDEIMAFESIEQEKASLRGDTYSESELYWMGYIYRYICYTRFVSSRLAYKWFKPALLRSLYEAYHTQSEESVVRTLMDVTRKDPALFDSDVRIKANLRKAMLRSGRR